MIKSFLSENCHYFVILPVVFFLSCFNISDFDAWTHLAFGRQLVENASFVSREVFIYPILSTTIENQSWLFQIPLYLSYMAGGIAGVIVFKALTAALIFFFFALLLRELGAGKIYIIIFSLLTAVLVRFRLVERPELFAYLFFIIFLLVLSKASHEKTRLVYLLPFIMILWVNSHQSASIGVMTVIVFGAGAVIDRYILKKGAGTQESLMWALLIVLTTAGYFINPYSYRNFFAPMSLASDFQVVQSVSEMSSVALDPAYFTAYIAVLIVVIFALMLSRKKIPSAWIILFGIFLYASFKVVRSLPLFFFTGMAVTASVFGNQADMKALIGKTWRTSLLVLLSLTIFFSGVYGRYSFGFDEERQLFPSGAIDFLKKNNLDSKRIFNYMGWGGYISFNLGQGRTFIDGRYVSGTLSDDYDHIMAASERWKGLTEKYGIELIVINSIGFSDGMVYPLIYALLSDSSWRPVYAGAGSLVFADIDRNSSLQEIPRNTVFQEMTDEAGFLYSIGIRGEIEKTQGKLYLKKQEYVKAKYYYGKWLEKNPSDNSARGVYDMLSNMGY